MSWRAVRGDDAAGVAPRLTPAPPRRTLAAGGEAMNRWSWLFAGIGACVVCSSIVLAIILVVAFGF